MGTDSGLVGVAGEYYVAAELSRRGYIASITLRTTKGVDILASNIDATASVAIQVKTSKGSKQDWVLSSKVEKGDLAENLFFVFVRLNGDGHPDYHVVSAATVAATVAKEHQEWLNTEGRGGRQHRDNPMRKFHDYDDKYLDAWASLGLD